METPQKPINWGMDTQNVVSPHVEYYSAIKKDRVPIYAPTWINLENMLTEIHHTQMDKYDFVYMKPPE